MPATRLLAALAGLLLLASLPAVAEAQAQAQAQAYTITRTRDGATIPLDTLAHELAAADVVVFGEEHDDSLGHRAQLALLVALYRQRPDGLALSMEMFETDHQLVLDEYLAGRIPEEHFARDGGLWPNYATDYRPLVEFARHHHLPVIAANAPQRYVSLVNRRGRAALDSLSPSGKTLLPPLPFDTLDGRYREKFFGLMGGHGAHASPNLYHAQNLWDASMAHQIATARATPGTRQVLHLCGRFHSDERLGTVEHLRRRAPDLHILTISAYPAASADADTAPAPLADYVIDTTAPAR